jgi:hypothetical protein
MIEFQSTLLSDPLGPPEQALRPHEQDHDQSEEGTDVLQFRRHPERDHEREHADQQRSDHRPVVGAQPAECHRGEHQQEELGAHQPTDLAVQAEEHGSRGDERPTDEPYGRDHPVDVDAGRGRQVVAVGDGPHRLAHLRLAECDGGTDEEEQPDHDDQEFLGQHVDGTDREQWVGLHGVLLVRAGTLAEEEQEEEAQEQRQPDGHDHHRRETGAAFAQRAPQSPVDRSGPDSTEDEGEHACEDQVDAEDGVEEVGHEGAEHDLFGQREVDEAGGSEDQRETDGAQPDDQAEDDPLVQQAGATGEDAVTLLVPGGTGGITFREVEQNPGHLAGACFDRKLLLVGSDQFDAGRERVHVQLDDVLAGPGKIHRDEPGRIGRAPTDLVADGLDHPIRDDRLEHDDLRAGHRILLAAVLGLGAQRRLDGLSRLSSGGRRRHE